MPIRKIQDNRKMDKELRSTDCKMSIELYVV